MRFYTERSCDSTQKDSAVTDRQKHKPEYESPHAHGDEVVEESSKCKDELTNAH